MDMPNIENIFTQQSMHAATYKASESELEIKCNVIDKRWNSASTESEGLIVSQEIARQTNFQQRNSIEDINVASSDVSKNADLIDLLDILEDEEEDIFSSTIADESVNHLNLYDNAVYSDLELRSERFYCWNPNDVSGFLDSLVGPVEQQVSNNVLSSHLIKEKSDDSAQISSTGHRNSEHSLASNCDFECEETVEVAEASTVQVFPQNQKIRNFSVSKFVTEHDQNTNHSDGTSFQSKEIIINNQKSLISTKTMNIEDEIDKSTSSI